MEENKIGVWCCEVCGREFPLMYERRYTVRNEIKSGLMAAIGSENEPMMWDAFDCPYCGCQNRTMVRKRTVEEQTGTDDTVDYSCDECGLGKVCPLNQAVDERDEGIA